jgi:hypothetical protein
MIKIVINSVLQVELIIPGLVVNLHAIVLVLPCYASKMPLKTIGSGAKYLLSTRGLLTKISTIILDLYGILAVPRPTQTGLVASLTMGMV